MKMSPSPLTLFICFLEATDQCYKALSLSEIVYKLLRAMQDFIFVTIHNFYHI